MRREMGPVDRLDPRLVLKVWGVLSVLAVVVLTRDDARSAVEGLLADTNAGAYVSSLWLIFVLLWVAEGTLQQVEDPKTLRVGIGFFALLHLAFLANVVVLSSHQTLHQSAFAFSFVLALTTVTIGLCYAWLMANGDPRPGWNRVIDLFRPGAQTPTTRMRSDYEDRVRMAAAQEERHRLARELHDSIKQQVFAIHTAAATAEARLAEDPQGTRQAIARVRESARDAMLEMEAMLDQMRAGPLTNASLLDAVRKQVEALRLRSGAEVTLEIGALPAEFELPPSWRQAIFRAAQETRSRKRWSMPSARWRRGTPLSTRASRTWSAAHRRASTL